MTNQHTTGSGSQPYTGLLWLWTVVSALGTGLILGNLFASQVPFSDEAEFNSGAFVGGVIGGAISAIPVWALFGIGTRLLSNSAAIRAELIRARTHNESPKAAAPPVPVVDVPPSPTSETEDVAPLIGVPMDGELGQVLSDAGIRKDVAEALRMYGRRTAADVLTRRARAAGFPNAAFTEKDLPADL